MRKVALLTGICAIGAVVWFAIEAGEQNQQHSVDINSRYTASPERRHPDVKVPPHTADTPQQPISTPAAMPADTQQPENAEAVLTSTAPPNAQSQNTESASMLSGDAAMKACFTSLRGKSLFAVADITSQYDDNEIRAESIFRDKAANVFGTVTDISTDLGSGAHVTLSGGDDASSSTKIACGVEQGKMAGFVPIHTGSILIVTGQGGQKILGTVFFHDCALVCVVPPGDWAKATKYVIDHHPELQNKLN